jgi:hypothetical protein
MDSFTNVQGLLAEFLVAVRVFLMPRPQSMQRGAVFTLFLLADKSILELLIIIVVKSGANGITGIVNLEHPAHKRQRTVG